ncbi:MAG: hypothetical protein IPL43_01400 [Micropruina sp.]|nr:hypothetical protein [Micropruina sp.]
MTWSGWFNLGAPTGGFNAGPATISRNKDVCNIYVRGTDNALWQRAWYDNSWHPWTRHNDGGVLHSEPALGSMGPDHEHVFVRGTDGNVWQKYWTAAGGWSGWFNLGAPTGGFNAGPATISRNKDVCNIYVRGTDNALWQRAWYDNSWHPWTRHNDGGVLHSEPALGSMGPDHEHVFVRGTDGNVWQKYWTAAGGWSGWFNLGAPTGGFNAGPATISRNKDVCNIYVRGTDNALWQRAWYDNSWHPWTRHNDGGVLHSEPALGSMGPDHEHVFVRGTDGNVWQKYWTRVVEPSAEVSFPVSECVYAWTSRFQQTGTHVTVRIQLNPDAGITAATMNGLRTTWRNGIIATWSNRFQCRAANGAQQALTFDVQWVTSNPHHVVRVQVGPARSNMGMWDTSDTGDVAAHEFGHMLGHPDEYGDAACPARNPVNTGTVMADNTESVARHSNRLATFHGAGHLPVAIAPEPLEANLGGAMTIRMIDSLPRTRRAETLARLRGMGAPGAAPDGAGEAEVAFEVSGGAPGERYSYRLGVQADGAAERVVVDQLHPCGRRRGQSQRRSGVGQPRLRGRRPGRAARHRPARVPAAAR